MININSNLKFKLFKIKTLICEFVNLSFVILCMSFVSSVHAQSLDMSIMPPQVRVIAKPGTSLIQAFTVGNNGDDSQFVLTFVSFKPDGNTGGRVFSDRAEGPVRFSLENADLAVDAPFSLGNSTTTQAIVKISVAPSAPEGDYYYVLFFESQPQVTQKTAGKGVGIVGANILISVSQDGTMDLRPSFAQLAIVPDYTFSLLGSPVYVVEPGHEVPTIVQVANKGAYAFNPEVTLTNVGPYAYNEKRTLVPVSVLAQSQRLMTQEEEPKCSACTTVFPSGMWGKYTLTGKLRIPANLDDIEDGRDLSVLYGSVIYWVLPVKMIGWISIAFLAGCGILIVHKMYKRKGMKKH